MRKLQSLLLILGTVIVPVAAARADDAPPKSDAALVAGEILGPGNWQKAEGLLPPEILAHYKDGGYLNPIVDWPAGTYKWDPAFKAASESNRDKFTVSPTGTVIEKASGKQPPFIFGLPFPNIDPADPDAGIKILWNFNYQYWSEGNTHNVVELTWVNPGSIDRSATQDVRFLYYDGQGERYRKPNPQNFSMQFVAVTKAPADLQGTAALTWRYRDAEKRDSNWVYVPALRRVRAVSPANRSDGFLGSDMSQDDGPFFDGKPEDFTWKLAGERDALRLVDPKSLLEEATQRWLSTGGWRSHYPEEPTVGFQLAGWQGLAWAPVKGALAKRSHWIVEGVPKDKYYLYGRIELYFDKETFQGAWSRKFSWAGELLNILQVVAYQKHELTRPDGGKEWLWASNFAFQCAENVKLNRATHGGLVPPGDTPNDRRIDYNPRFFDFTSLQQLGK